MNELVVITPEATQEYVSLVSHVSGRRQAYAAASQLEIMHTRVHNLKAKLRNDSPELVSATTQLKLRAADGKRYNTDYIKKMKKRDPSLAEGWGQIVTPLSVQIAGGKQRVNCATQQGLFRIIQSIPSLKAEPFKQWMAQVAAHRLDQMQDKTTIAIVESIGACSQYVGRGFDCRNIPTKEPKGYTQSAKIVKEGGSVAKAERKQLESKTGKSAISSSKASDYLLPPTANEEK